MNISLCQLIFVKPQLHKNEKMLITFKIVNFLLIFYRNFVTPKKF